MQERFQEDFNYDDSIANYGYIKKPYIYKVVIQGGALHNLVVSVKTRLQRVTWAGRDLTQRCRTEGDDRVQPHSTDSTWVLLPKLFSCSRALPEAWQQGIVPALYLLLQTRGQRLLQSGINLPSHATGFHVHALPGLLQGGSAHWPSTFSLQEGHMRCQAEEGNAVHQGGKKEGSCP